MTRFRTTTFVRRIVLGFVLITAVVAMHHLTALSPTTHKGHEFRHAASAPDGSPCHHDSNQNEDCSGSHACAAILVNSDSVLAAVPLVGWVEPFVTDREAHISAQCSTSLRGPPNVRGLTQAELSMWRL